MLDCADNALRLMLSFCFLRPSGSEWTERARRQRPSTAERREWRRRSRQWLPLRR